MAKKPGKYAHLTPLLPKYYGAEAAKKADKINELKRQIQSEPGYLRTAVSLVETYIAIRREKNRLKAKLKEVQLRLDAVTQLMDVQMREVEGTTSLTLVNHDSVRIEEQPYFSVANPEENRLWALENGFERSMSLGWQKLNSTGKELLLEGEDLPAGTKVWAMVKPVFSPGVKGNPDDYVEEDDE